MCVFDASIVLSSVFSVSFLLFPSFHVCVCVLLCYFSSLSFYPLFTAYFHLYQLAQSISYRFPVYLYSCLFPECLVSPILFPLGFVCTKEFFSWLLACFESCIEIYFLFVKCSSSICPPLSISLLKVYFQQKN